MKLDVSIGASLVTILRREYLLGEEAVSHAVAEAGDELKQSWRNQIVAAGLGRRLAGTIRSEYFPRHTVSMNAATLVWSKAPRIVSAHDEGSLIRSRDGFWLAIPTEAAGKHFTGRKMTPGEWEQRTGLRLRFVYRPGRPALLVADEMRAKAGRRGGFAVASATARRTGRGLTTVPIFVLVPQVKLAKRLDLEADARRVQAGLPGRIVAEWNRRSMSS